MKVLSCREIGVRHAEDLSVYDTYSECIFYGVSLKALGLDFRNKTFCDCIFSDVQAEGVDFSGSRFIRCRFGDKKEGCMNLHQAVMEHCRFYDCVFEHAVFFDQFLVRYSKFHGCEFSQTLSSGDFSGCRFYKCRLPYVKSSVYSDAFSMNSTVFEDCELCGDFTGMDFSFVYL